MPLTIRRAVCISEICAYVNTAARVVISTKMAIPQAGRVYSHFDIVINTFGRGHGTEPFAPRPICSPERIGQ